MCWDCVKYQASKMKKEQKEVFDTVDKEKVWYGLMDKFLYNNAIESKKPISKSLVAFKFESKEDLIDYFYDKNKLTVKVVMDRYKAAREESKEHISLKDFLLQHFSDKYIVSYIEEETCIKITDKSSYINESLSKYMVLL